MLFDKKYDDKEIECPHCHKKIKPIIEKNNFVPGVSITTSSTLGRVGLGLSKPKKNILICPNCKAVIGTK